MPHPHQPQWDLEPQISLWIPKWIKSQEPAIAKRQGGGRNRWAQTPSLTVRLNELCFFPQLAILSAYNSEHWRINAYIQFLPPSSALWHWKHAQPILTFSSPRAPVQAGWANKRLVTAKYGPTLAPARIFQPLWSQTHLHSSIWSKTLILWKICSLSKSCALTHAFKVSYCHAARGSSRLPKKEGAGKENALEMKGACFLFQFLEGCEDCQ